jgi:ABC-type phosphate transport system ATPase subunit
MNLPRIEKLIQPYPGLRPFERHESKVFFGREKQIDDLLARLKQRHFLAVLGASGSGKS